jgi:hypothetical protein
VEKGGRTLRRSRILDQYAQDEAGISLSFVVPIRHIALCLITCQSSSLSCPDMTLLSQQFRLPKGLSRRKQRALSAFLEMVIIFMGLWD